MKTSKLFFLFIALLTISCSKNGVNNPKTSLPQVSISDATVNRENTGTVCRFYVDLSTETNDQVSVHYATSDGSATSGKDYTAQSGVLTFKPGDKELSIDVPIKGDSLRQTTQKFTVQLSNPQNCTIDVNQAVGTIINDGTYLPTDTSGYESPTSYSGYHLVWSDEFNEKQLNQNEWNYETGGNGWGNNELEYYTSRPQNVFLSSGNLIIEARKENYSGNYYTSARITTQGKEEFTYGRIDIRAKLPVATGMWPALWMLGSNISAVGWPECGETDIMELIGKNAKQVIGSLHWKKSDGTVGTFNNAYSLTSEDFSQHFHVFSLTWSKDSLQISVDSVTYVKASRQDISNGIYPFDNPSFFIFNVAVGGNWPGPPDESTQFPQRMFVDYVRVFQKN